ncbi:MAG: hypothetical protein VB035_04565 [Candidatus Fimivivens sp.]|nr:hypothetical protein [Candidatus Fimivivens sp.]
MTKTQEVKTRRALKRVEACNGDCKHCEHCRVPCNGMYYAFLCGFADDAGYTPMSNTTKRLKPITLFHLKFELNERGFEKLNVYQENGYESREDYFQAMADEYDCPIEIVREVAETLGENEDFDGLISSLKDYARIY